MVPTLCPCKVCLSLVFLKLLLDLNSSAVVPGMWCRQLTFYFKLISCVDLLLCTLRLCCFYLGVFHKVPAQNTWSDFVYLLAVSWELMSDESSVDWNSWPPGSRLFALLRWYWTSKRNQLVSAPRFQPILVLLLTLAEFKTSCGCETRQVGDYLGGFQPSAFLTFCNTGSKGIWSQLCWLCVSEETQIISAPFCASPGKGREWNLGTSSLSQMPWENLQSYRIKYRLMRWFNLLLKLLKQSESGRLYLFIFKSIFYSWMCCLIYVDFSLTFWKKGSRNNSDSSIQADCQHMLESKIQHNQDMVV